MIDPAALGLGAIVLPNGQEIWVRKASFASQASAVRDLSPAVRLMADGTSVLGPGEPPAAAHPEEGEPRRWAYQPGINLPRQPRSTEAISFTVLRTLAANYDVLRLAIEHRKNEMRGLEYIVAPRPIPGMQRAEAKARGTDLQPQVDAAMALLEKPNREDFWSVWLGQWLEDLFVVDAPTVFLRPTRGGELYSAELVNGETIRPLVDTFGRIPEPPEPAYGQVLYGQTWGLYTTDEILYTPYWQHTDSPYGHPPAEWILMAISRAMRRQSIDLSQYTEGTLPVAFYRVPETWQGAQIKELQDIWDGLLAGNDVQRSRVRFVPGGTGAGLDQVHAEPKTEVEEWLLYLTCAAVGVQPTDIGFHPRGSGLGGKGFTESQQDSTTSRVTKPTANHVKGVVDIILARAGWPDLELKFPSLEKSDDLLKRAQSDAIYLKNGKVSVDELRERDDEDPIGLGPYVTGNVTLVEDILNPPAPPAGPPIDPATGLPLALPPAGPADQKLLADGKTDPIAADGKPNPDGLAKIAGELGAWERKAIKAVRAGRPALVQFTTDVVPDELGAAVDRHLAKVSTVAGVRDAFRLAKAGASADPFASSTSASSSSSGATTSPPRPAGFWAGSSSGRRPYP